MKSVRHSFQHSSFPYAWFVGPFALLLCVFLAACGASSVVLGGGVGSGGSGVAEGAVSGFGSVIVDGVTYADSDATVVMDNAAGTQDVAEVKIGQRVRVRHQTTGVADEIRVMPQLRGPASTTQNAGWFQMLGQWVRIETVTDLQTTATIMEGLTSVTAGMDLEVHGTWTLDTDKNALVLVASRIEKLASAADPLWVSGAVQSRVAGINSLVLAGATPLTISAPLVDSSIVAGSLVTAWVPASKWVGASMTADRLVDVAAGLAADDRWVVTAPVLARDVARGEITVQGQRIKLPSPLLTNAPAPGTSVQIEMVRDGAAWKAVSLQERGNPGDLGGTVEIKGALSLPNDTSSPLRLRGTSISLTGLSLDASCESLKGRDNVFVSLQAARGAPGQPLQASRLSCSLNVPDNGVIEVQGRLLQFNVSSKTLSMSTLGGTLALSWSDNTWLPAQPLSLINQVVEVEYQIVNGQNRLRKLKPH